MSNIVYYSDNDYIGEGVSLGIARGILVKYKGANIVQEGTGIGSLALKIGLMTYFASTCKTVQLNETQFRKTFVVDSVMLWGINDRPSKFLTGIIDLLSQFYMLFPGLQNKLLKTGTLFRNLFRLTPELTAITTLAEGIFDYCVGNGELNIKCEINSFKGYLNNVFILNELGADYFQKSIKNGKIVPPPSGWKYIGPNPDSTFLYSPDHNLSFSIKNICIKNQIKHEVFWGREKIKDLSWAGFEIKLDCSRKKIKSFGCEYTAKINE
jgi:hypothetical protein